VAEALDMSVSEVSRLERGVRGLRVDQLQPWAKSLRKQVELVIWDDNPSESWDEESLHILSEVATALPHLPKPARAALLQQMRIWTEASSDRG
jgi:transcriptional regulator with XRE-family HTH domain